MTETGKVQNEVKIKTNVLNIHEQVSNYKTHINQLLRICKFDKVQYFTKAASLVIDMGNEIKCLHEAYVERRKHINQSSNININNLVSDKFIPTEKDRFLRYHGFINNFKENILKKNLKPAIKLEILKLSLGGEVFDAIRLHNQGDQSYLRKFCIQACERYSNLIVHSSHTQ